MEYLKIIIPILVGALIGYCTNYIAIKMLFRPRKPVFVNRFCPTAFPTADAILG